MREPSPLIAFVLIGPGAFVTGSASLSANSPDVAGSAAVAWAIAFAQVGQHLRQHDALGLARYGVGVPGSIPWG